MRILKRRLKTVLVVLAAAAALPVQRGAAQQKDSATRVMRLTPGKRFVLDFSGSPDGGVSAGNFNNFAFSLDLRDSVRRIAIRRDESRPDVIASYDFADCSKGQESLLEKPLVDLARGAAVWVDYVDVELMPFPQRELKWEGGVCFGYRNQGGAWHWRLATTPLVYDAAADRVRARVWVKEANVDALKLVFDKSVPRHFVRTVTVTTQPARLEGIRR